jgi:hypothetical protein
MSPRIKAAKVEAVKSVSGRIQIAFGLGERIAPVILKAVKPVALPKPAVFPVNSFVSLAQFNHANESEPVQLLHETEEQYIDRLYTE